MAGEILAQGTMVERLAERLGARASAATVYGTPVEHDGITVIPVAKVRYGFGGGGGASGQGETGSGGGGGVQADPLGFIEVGREGACFRPIEDPVARQRALVGLVVGAGLASWLILRGLKIFFPSRS